MFIIITIFILIFYMSLFRFKPRKSNKIYSLVFAHRGFHLFHPENTIPAYKAAIDAKIAIELDVRQTKDGVLICFHDRYTKRLLNIPGKISMFNYQKLKKYKIQKSNEKIPTLEKVLQVIDGNVDVLIEIKGKLNSKYVQNLKSILEKYEGNVYFHTKDVLSYFKLKKIFDKNTDEKKVYYILNIFRKRFNFVKGRDYSSEQSKYNELASDVDVEIPSVEDILSIIVKNIEEMEDKREILATIGAALNKYQSRINLKDKSHWVYHSLWLHRGIVSDKYLEHSNKGFKACKKYAIDNGISMTVEFDVMLHRGEVLCYHKDRISTFLGQSKSCAEKLKLKKALTLKEILEIFNGCKNINLAIDIKDYHMRNRTLEDLIIRQIEEINYKGNFIIMSYNPLVLSYLKEKKPEWLRAQVGHSLSGLRRVPIFRFPTILNGILGMLFDLSCADCIVLDNSNWIYYLIAYHKNIKGKPVLIYAPKSFTEQEAFIGYGSVANFIIENVADKTKWPKNYIDRFKMRRK